MKKGVLFIIILFITISTISFAAPQAQKQKPMISLLQHQKELNVIICQKKAECNDDIYYESCLQAWDKVAEININYSKIMIPVVNSIKCKEYLQKEATCKNLHKIYTEMNCSHSALRYQ